MTRSEQKDREVRIVANLLGALGLRYEIENLAEPPDVIVRIEGQRIGIEVTEYHDSADTPAGVPRRVVEAWWQKIREAAVRFRKSNPFVDNLHVYLRFSELNVPAPKDADNFVRDISQFLRRHSSDFGDDWVELPVRKNEDLGRFVSIVRVRRTRDYWAEWDWNHDTARVGLTEADLLAALSKKLLSSNIDGIGELWLAVADGWRMSQVIAAFSAERLASFLELTRRLEASPYARTFLLDFELYEWSRGRGWRVLQRGGWRNGAV